MNELAGAFGELRYGGAFVYPLLLLGALGVLIIVDRAVAYYRCLRMPRALADLVETYDFSWDELERQLAALAPVNVYRRFFGVISANRARPAWWVESRAGDEAGEIERHLGRGLWILETVVTAAPLIGLLGTITGMMQAFKVIGGSGLVAPAQVTAGVAEALISTALGLLIALIALFGFNFYARTQSRTLDHLERLGSKLVDHIRLDEQLGAAPAAAGLGASVRQARVNP
ncbi:MAG TPA: MotA/TolQ/ExbB proton channel family protein [Candidatus Binataceae bacterium]|nr:MotA/TolQ/ExbB proton channel family protein [Candidatus Binataceae bacterium]